MSDDDPGQTAGFEGLPERVPGVLVGEAFRHVLEVELARSRRYDTPFVLLKITLDAPSGDSAGGERRRKIAGAVRAATRWADSVGAADGALIVILRETDGVGADAVIAKMRTRIEEVLAESAAASVAILKATWRKGDDLDSLTARFK